MTSTHQYAGGSLGRSILIGLAFISSVGCLAPQDDPYLSSTGTYVVEEGWMEGNMPIVGPFDADAYSTLADYGSVTLHAGEDGGDFNGWAMARLEMSPAELVRLDGPRAVPTVGCSGPQHNTWVWDATTAVVVRVEPGATAEERLVHFEGTWSNARVEGGFTIRQTAP